MLRTTFKIILGVYFFCFPFFDYASLITNDHGGNRVRLHLGPAIGFYKVNPSVADEPRMHFSALIGFTKEFKLGRDSKTFFLIGVDYFYHGLNYNSYYFPPGTVKLYNNNFNYNYTLYINELNIPFEFKYLFKREDNSLYSPYIGLTYHLRYFLPGSLKVTQDGNLIKEDGMALIFETPLLVDQMNAAISLSGGWQKNNLSNSKGSFYAELNFRYCFSPYYFEKDYAANSLYINSMHLTLQLGIKF